MVHDEFWIPTVVILWLGIRMLAIILIGISRDLMGRAYAIISHGVRVEF